MSPNSAPYIDRQPACLCSHVLPEGHYLLDPWQQLQVEQLAVLQGEEGVAEVLLHRNQASGEAEEALQLTRRTSGLQSFAAIDVNGMRLS